MASRPASCFNASGTRRIRVAYRVEFSAPGERDLRRLPRAVRERLEQSVLSFENEPRPRGARKIRGTESTYRLRVGDYRVIYEVLDSEQLVIILAARRRAENTYRGF